MILMKYMTIMMQIVSGTLIKLTTNFCTLGRNLNAMKNKKQKCHSQYRVSNSDINCLLLGTYWHEYHKSFTNKNVL